MKAAIMKILALVGSPRKGGNTDTLIGEILKGCRTTGHTSEKLYLYDYEISACTDCRSCKSGDYVCVLCDGMQQIYPKMEEADVIIFGTPIYWYGPTAKMKLLVDRMRPFIARQESSYRNALRRRPEGLWSSGCNVS
jgi:multimeric flavodoxin WrbA